MVFLFISTYRVPTTPSDFKEYLVKEHGIYCAGTECLQLSYKDAPTFQASTSDIEYLDIHWYVLWSRAELTTSEYTVNPINILGFWFSTRFEY